MTWVLFLFLCLKQSWLHDQLCLPNYMLPACDFSAFFYKSPFASKCSWKKRSSHHWTKEVACIVSKPLVSCLWGYGESVNPPKMKHPGGSGGFVFLTFVKSHLWWWSFFPQLCPHCVPIVSTLCPSCVTWAHNGEVHQSNRIPWGGGEFTEVHLLYSAEW